MKKLIIHYAYGMFAAAWNGAIGAVAAIVAIDGASLTGLSSQARVLKLHEMLLAFAGTFIIRAIMWLSAHPLPDDITTEHPFPPKTTP